MFTISFVSPIAQFGWELDRLYFFLISGSFWTSLVLAIILVYSSCPRQFFLKNYNRAKHIMVFTNLIVVVFNILLMTGILQKQYQLVVHFSTLMVFSLLLILYIHINLTLLNYTRISEKLIIYQSIPFCILISLEVISFIYGKQESISALLWHIQMFFCVITLLIIFRIYFTHRKLYRKKFDKQTVRFSTIRLSLIYHSSRHLLATGIIVCLIPLLAIRITSLFYFVAIPFFIGQTIIFLQLRSKDKELYAVSAENEKKEMNEAKRSISLYSAFSRIEDQLIQWEDNKQYINKNITISSIASELITNREYLSQYINRVKNKTVRDWINGLRIEEAKRLMFEDNEIPTVEISEKVGYNDISYFCKCFKKYAGMTVRNWKDTHVNNSILIDNDL